MGALAFSLPLPFAAPAAAAAPPPCVSILLRAPPTLVLAITTDAAPPPPILLALPVLPLRFDCGCLVGLPRPPLSLQLLLLLQQAAEAMACEWKLGRTEPEKGVKGGMGSAARQGMALRNVSVPA